MSCENKVFTGAPAIIINGLATYVAKPFFFGEVGGSASILFLPLLRNHATHAAER